MVGTVLGKYRLTERLAVGGFGEVYRAEHVEMGQKAAVKLLLPQYCGDPAFVERFFREARAAARVEHDAIVQIFDCGWHEGRAYLIMELLRGESLAERLARLGRSPPAEAVHVTRQVAMALRAAHEAGIVHRDLKPENLHVTPSALPGGLWVTVLDFGIARLLDDARHTHPGTILGSPEYMAPEQWRDAHEVDARTDLYALGCILYALGTGAPPFPDDGQGGWQRLMDLHLHQAPPRLRDRVPALAPALDALAWRLVAKRQEDRPASAAELVAELDALPAPPGPDVRRRRAWPLLVGWLVTVIVAVVVALLLLRPWRPRAAEPLAAAPAASFTAAAPARSDPGCQGDGRAACAREARLRRAGLGGAPQDSVRAVLLFRDACRAGAMDACAALAWMQHTGIGAERDVAAALELERQACDGGIGAACYSLGWTAAWVGLDRHGPDATGAISRFDRGCQLGDGDSCYQLGWRYLQGHDHARARPLLEKACGAGSSVGCERWAWQLDKGLGGDPDAPAARKAYVRACELGALDACFLAEERFGGHAVPEADLPALGKLCDAGDAPACFRLGWMAFVGRETKRDLDEAATRLKTACLLGHADGCALLQRVVDATGTLPLASGKYREAACAVGSLEACSDAAVVRRAHDDSARLCDLGSTDACYRAARDDYYGLPPSVPKKDPKAALQRFRALCDLGSPDGCGAAGHILLWDPGAPADRDRGRALIVQACHDGAGFACADLGYLYDNEKKAKEAEEADADGCRLGAPRSCEQQASRAADDKTRDERLEAAFVRYRWLCVTNLLVEDCRDAIQLGEKLRLEAPALASPRRVACVLDGKDGC